MRRLLLSFVCALALTSPAFAVEDLTLTTPETKPTIQKWRLDRLTIDRSGSLLITTFVEPTTGETRICTETGAAATAILSTLNTANLTTNSLQKRALTRAQTTGCLGAGAVSGTAD